MAYRSLPFFNELTGLRSDTTHDWGGNTKGRAPHKPFLLLSVLDGIESGWITGAQVELSRDLVDTFFTYWNAVMGAIKLFSCTTTCEEPFWLLITK